jgi:cell volume regulation protein A
VLALLLLFVIRPIAVWASIPVGSFSTSEKMLLGWAGLRGAVPIVLGTFVLSAHIEHSEQIFNIVFFIVLISALIQGTTLERVAHNLGVIDRFAKQEKGKEDLNLPELVEFDVLSQHSIAGSRVNEVGLPKKAHITAIMRKQKAITPKPDTHIRAGDCLIVSAPKSIRPELEDVFTRWRRRV